MNLYAFPYAKVRHNSKIIIYGAGEVGQSYLNQVRLTKYCHVVCILDRNYSWYTSLPVKVCAPENVLHEIYDVIVVANNSPAIAGEIMSVLINEYNVHPSKIIYENKYITPVEVIREGTSYLHDEELGFSHSDHYAIAVNLEGGYGDYIVRKQNIEELSNWDNKILLDIYVGKGKVNFAKNLFRNVKNIHTIVESDKGYSAKSRKYLASFRFTAFLIVDYIDNSSLGSIPVALKDKLQQIQNVYKQYGLKEAGILFSLHYSRCMKDGLNCYTAYNRYGAFHVQNFKTDIPLVKHYEKEYKELELTHYITMNYGWDRNLETNKIPAKVWPIEYFSKLASLIHDNFPPIHIVQIGMQDSPKISGCQSFVFGKDIELIKYVLRDSMLHIDCEGGMVHMATQLGTKCAVLFGPTPSEYYGYESNLNIIAEICHNCYWFVSDCVSCYQGFEKPKCMYSILPEMVMNIIQEELKRITNSF